MIKITSEISISLQENLPILEEAISCYKNYVNEKKDELSYELMRLASKGYKKANQLVDVLLRGFAEKYRNEFYKKDFGVKVQNILKEGFDAMADSSSFEIEANKLKIRIPYPSLNLLGVIASKLKIKKWIKSGKKEYVELDGKELIKINDFMQKNFKVAMNSYFTYLMKDEFIPLVLNDDKETSKFHDRYLEVLNEVDKASNLQFVEWLFPNNDELWEKLYQN